MIRRPRDVLKKEYLTGKECGRALMSDFLCRKKKKKSLYTKEEKELINSRLIPTDKEKNDMLSYLNADKWLSENQKFYFIRALDVDRHSMLAVALLMSIERECLRLQRVPFCIADEKELHKKMIHPIDMKNIELAGISMMVQDGSITNRLNVARNREPFPNLKKMSEGKIVFKRELCEEIRAHYLSALACDKAVSLLAEYFKEPDIEVMRGDIDTMKTNISVLNKLIKSIDDNLLSCGLDKLVKEAEKNWKTVDIDTGVPEDKINRARDLLKKAKYFTSALGDDILKELGAKE